ncbi:MAG: SDR family oxidoreductase, partial [Pseudomonadota bacterium]
MTQTAVVTGAGSGLGAAATETLLTAGWNVALLGRRAEALEAVAAGRAAAVSLPTDVTDPAAVDAAFAATVARFGRVDCVFNNAGGNVAAAPIDEISVEDWKKVVDVNLTGAFLVARAAIAPASAET